jgi:hypothetical protein
MLPRRIFAAVIEIIAQTTGLHAQNVEEKRLRAWYCLGSVNYVASLIVNSSCEGLPDALSPGWCARSVQQAKINHEAQRRRLLLYLMSTGNLGDSGVIAMAQGKSDAERCFTQLDD